MLVDPHQERYDSHFLTVDAFNPAYQLLAALANFQVRGQGEVLPHAGVSALVCRIRTQCYV
jgi:hypothetical protein